MGDSQRSDRPGFSHRGSCWVFLSSARHVSRAGRPIISTEGQRHLVLEPAVKGISIDAMGKISVDADVPHGTTAIVHADVDGGRRNLLAKVFAFRTEENPLIGAWHVDTRVACGESQEIKTAAAGPLSLRGKDWKFHVNQQFWVGKEHNIAAGVRLTGAYELDLKALKIKLTPTWPKKPPSNWNYLLKDGDKTLILLPLEPQEDLERGCGYVLVR